ncbi:CD2 antigen cytoplasmic tail-binding protein 2 homolog isoform X2 [Anabrus simplex]
MSVNDLEEDWLAEPAKVTVDKKNSLDSDEEDDGEGKNYEIMADDDIEGQEEGAAGFDGEVQITPFNMKEELQEGHFDTEGNYHWKKEGKVIKDNWLENIDWVKIKQRDEDAQNEDSDEESSPASPFDHIPVYRQMLELMKPGESVSKSLRRLGGSKTMSASERWRRKKAGLADTSEENRQQVTDLTELANTVLTKTGNMDIYQETYEQIDSLVKSSEAKGKAPVKTYEDALDMYADDFDEKERERISKRSIDDDESEPPRKMLKTEESSVDKAGGGSEVQWEYKWKVDDDEVHGPYSTEQMQAWVTEGYFKQAVWVRRIGQQGQFYTSQRVDFELYL